MEVRYKTRNNRISLYNMKIGCLSYPCIGVRLEKTRWKSLRIRAIHKLLDSILRDTVFEQRLQTGTLVILNVIIIIILLW